MTSYMGCVVSEEGALAGEGASNGSGSVRRLLRSMPGFEISHAIEGWGDRSTGVLSFGGSGCGCIDACFVAFIGWKGSWRAWLASAT